MDPRDLCFNNVYADHVRLHYGPNWTGSVDDYVLSTVLTLHSLTAMDAISGALFQAITLSDSVTAPGARSHLRFGLGRRFDMLFYAYRDLVLTAPPERTEPLTSDDTRHLNVALNVIYLNIRGALDNLAWALIHERAPEKAALNPSQIALFAPVILNDARFSSLCSTLEEHRSWSSDLRDRRDPVAHRIPLAIPPQVLRGPDELRTYNELSAKHTAAVNEKKFDHANEISERMDQVGKFLPVFSHSPDEPPLRLYPTVPEDIGQLVVVFNASAAFLAAHKGQDG